MRSVEGMNTDDAMNGGLIAADANQKLSNDVRLNAHNGIYIPTLT